MAFVPFRHHISATLLVSNKLTNFGIWAMQKWKKFTSIDQLSMNDAKDIRETFMYRISKYKGLSWFKHVVLFSSVQDGYVTFDSARMQIFKNTSVYDPNKQGSAYIEMATNIDFPKSEITRVDCNFMKVSNGINKSIMKIDMKNNSIDYMIGRKAHILFLSNTEFLTMLTHRFKETLF